MFNLWNEIDLNDFRVGEESIAAGRCFICHYWVALLSASMGVIVEKEGKRIHYTIGTRKIPSRHNGFSGAWWVIHYKDGRIVETCDLWYQGGIPERFWHLCEINAIKVHNVAKSSTI